MIEIFTKATGAGGKAERVFGDSVNLKTTADVHFGTASPGIAFYEKSGADLRVTLLDGKVVTLQNFFAAGPNGEFSRLLVAENGAPEVTGLIAPEPFVPRDDAPVLTSAPAVDAAPAPSQPAPAAAAEAHLQDPVVAPQAGESGDAALAAADGAGGGTVFGMPVDLMLFGAANIGLLWAGLSNSNDGPSAEAEPAPVSATLAMDPELALLFADDAAPADGLDLLLSAGAEAETLGSPETAAVFGDGSEEITFAADAAPLSGFDDLFLPVSAI